VSTETPKKFGIGQPLSRFEDKRLVTGGGRFQDDRNLPGQAYAVFVRSPHANARLVRIETAEAAAMPGVLAIFTGVLMADIWMRVRSRLT
jgi:aerobic carbon-monoxide dehydrogenase large subunit